jgi:hypothetical protein
MRSGLVLLLALISARMALPLHAAQFQEITPSGFPTAVGVGWGDYDSDGYPDLFVGGNNQGDNLLLKHGPFLFRNNHDLAFTSYLAGYLLNSL